MIAIDTSVWIEANRRPAGETAETLRGLIDADEVLVPLPVRLELSAGLARQHRVPFLRAFSALPVAIPGDETWTIIESWIAPAADKGHRFAVTDLLIAGVAHELGALVWSRDADFVRLGRLGFVRLFER